jgi:putrescine transport system substrate-binding protein
MLTSFDKDEIMGASNFIRHFLLLASLCIVLLSAAKAAEKVVYVYNWSDYISEEAIAGFTQQTGIRVIYDVYDSNEVLEAKLLAGKSGYDLVFAAARPYTARQVQAKLLRPLDKSKLPNLKNINVPLLASLQDVDPGNQFAVPYMWGTTGLGVNVNKVRAALGKNVALDSWQLMFDPANAAKLKGCGISLLDDEAEGLGAIMVALGKTPQSSAPADLSAAAKLVAAIRPNVRYFHSSRYISDLATGDTCLAMGYSGDILQAQARAIEAKNGVNIRYIIPKEGAIRWMDLMLIPRDARHAEEAHALINYLLTPAVIAQISGEIGYANPNDAAKALMDPALLADPGVYPPASIKLVDNALIAAADKRRRVRAWTNMKAGRQAE